MTPPRLLFVCLGNICRSAAANGIMQQLASDAGIEVVVDSAGTYGGHRGQLPDPRMRKHASQRGYILSHRARKVRSSDFDDFDVIFAMDDNNFYDLKQLAPSPQHEKKLRRFASFIKGGTYSYVPDPYYEGADGFELVLDLLEDGCNNILNLIVNNKPI